MTDTINRVIAVMEDLMFMVRIQEAAKKVGLETVAVKSRAAAIAQAAQQPLLIVIDLNYLAAEPIELIQALKAGQVTKSIHLLGFVSHVQADLRAEAVASGCDTVLPRSAFAQRLPEVIQQCLTDVQPK